mmetsp:Transcript_76975/g.213954  ORF Transcript_76975/g.213954 Transcript_76975/m.213954 type:complete len:203 (+) Transcript_76975:501-1109(+)
MMTGASTGWRPQPLSAPAAMPHSPSKKTYHAENITTGDANFMIRSEPVKSITHGRRKMSTTEKDKAAMHKPVQMAASAAPFAFAVCPAPSSLLTLVFAAMPRLSGGTKKMELTFPNKATAAKLRSAFGKAPAMRMVISDAHHSEIIKKFGSARRMNGRHCVSARLDQPCHEFCSCVRKMLLVLHTIQIIMNTLPQHVAMAAP